jgi:hypothetical protein
LFTTLDVTSVISFSRNSFCMSRPVTGAAARRRADDDLDARVGFHGCAGDSGALNEMPSASAAVTSKRICIAEHPEK